VTNFDSTNLPEEAILIMLSGGIDSTYALFKYLRDTEFPIHVHHISMRVKEEPRYTLEDGACGRIANFCGGFRQFTYSESIYGFDLPYTGWDTDVQLLMGARVAANLEAERVTLVLGINRDDMERQEIKERVGRNVLPTFWSAQIASIDPERRDRISPIIHLPFKDVTKSQMIQELPSGLLALTWSCRTPREVDDEYRPCGECHACLAKIAAMQKCGKS